MPNNRIDAVLTAEDLDAIRGAVATIRQRMPFLTDVAPAERKRLPKMGDKSRAFVSKALEIASQSPRLLPPELLAQLRRDVELTEALQPVVVMLLQLHELVSGTVLLAGSEAYCGALAVYEMVKRAGAGEALDELADQLGQRFERAASPAKPPEPVS